MKQAGLLLIGLLYLGAACRSASDKRKIIVENIRDSEVIADTPPSPDPLEKNRDVAGPKHPTHLRDTMSVSGNFILFLRPDDKRFEAETGADAENGMMEADADFGAGITVTTEILKDNPDYKGIRVLVSMRRYIHILDCKGGPLMIDRDTVNYGYIISGIGMPVSAKYNDIHSGNYIQEINEYFALR